MGLDKVFARFTFEKNEDTMNRIYKCIWNAVRGCFVVVNEAVKTLGGQSSGGRAKQGSQHFVALVKPLHLKKSLIAEIIGFGLLAVTANVQAMTNEEFAEMMDTEFARYSDGTYTNLPYAEKMDFSASYSNGGAHVNGDLSAGILWIHPSKGQVASEFNGVEVWGYTKINGNLNVDQLYIDAESFRAATEQLGVYNVGADAIEVTGKTVAREIISAGYGYFQDLEVTGRLSMGYDFPFVENDDVTDLGPGSAELAAKHPSMAIVAKNLKANTIQNGMNINVSETLTVENDSINNGIIRVGGSSHVKGLLNNGIFNAHDFALSGEVVNSGDLVITGTLEFSENSILISSGNLVTGFENIFQDSERAKQPLNVIDISAHKPVEIQIILTEFFSKYVPGEIAKDLSEHASFTGGKVTITGVNLTTTQVIDLTEAFKEAFLLFSTIAPL